MIRIQTDGSVWLIDEERKLYWRFPLDEAPRDPVEYGDASAGVLQDAVPHACERWWVAPVAAAVDGFGNVIHSIDKLFIETTAGMTISAPRPIWPDGTPLTPTKDS